MHKLKESWGKGESSVMAGVGGYLVALSCCFLGTILPTCPSCWYPTLLGLGFLTGSPVLTSSLAYYLLS
jgi:hypothetical protein